MVLISNNLWSQKQDFIWLYGDEPYDIIIPTRAADTTKGACNIDFNFDPPVTYYDPKRFLDITVASSSICNDRGEIMAYTNGMAIYNKYNQPFVDTINYGADWEYNNFGDDSLAIPGGLWHIQGVLILPYPGVENLYYTFYSTFDRSNIFYNNFQVSYATFEVSNDNKDGTLIKKDIVLLQDSLSGSITAIRHGNGRDWWLIAPRRHGNAVFVWLVDKEGIKFHTKYETGYDELPGGGTGQVYASPDGSWLSWFVAGKFTETGGQIYLSNFDRCTGVLSNSNYRTVDLSNFGFSMGVSFSPDSRYLYMCNRLFIYQYDLNKEVPLDNQNKVAVYDGYQYTFSWDTINPIPRDVNFCFMGLAPDGRIYISSSAASTRMMSVMNFPEEQGVACNVAQHSLLMPTGITRGIPNFPNYRLGPLDGSPCDTLGIDNHPIAKYRYEPDTINHLRIKFTDLSYFRPETWSWDFDDGSPNENMRHPYHTYEKNGTYNVCLTVGNENSNNTSCRTITLGTSSSDDIAVTPADITLFPNPVQDYLLVTLGEYIPQRGQIMIYDISGRPVHTQRIYYGQNNVDMTKLATGMYVWMVMDGKKEIKNGKVVKVE